MHSKARGPNLGPPSKPDRYITVEGFFPVSKGYPDDLHRAVLNKDVFKPSIKRLRVVDLRVMTDMEKIYGSFFNPTHVHGVIDITGSLIPFFVRREKVQRLRELIDEELHDSDEERL